jgi:DNA (cytosine-5)-methyltransferase 1
MRCLSLFSGAGGLDLGLSAAGFELAASVEIDADCCDTLRKNFEHKVLEKPVEKLSGDDLAALGTIDVIAGGPPCQPFSKSAMWTTKAAQGLADKRASSLGYFFDCVGHVRPKAFMLENVDGFVARGGLSFVEERLSSLGAQGLAYDLHWKVVDAADYGVPQHRRRFIAVGTRSGLKFAFPQPTHGGDADPFMVSWDAIAALSRPRPDDPALKLRGRWADLVRSVPPGKNYLWHTPRGGGLPIFGWRTRYWSFLLKLDPTRPAPTLVASPSQNSGPFHWDNRLLSIDEMAALQTFPVGFTFSGSEVSQRRQLGNAVPPLLGEVLGRSIAQAFRRNSADGLVHLPTRASLSSNISALEPVPLKYLYLVGEHPEHPGTGLGPKPRAVVGEAAIDIVFESSKVGQARSD